MTDVLMMRGPFGGRGAARLRNVMLALVGAALAAGIWLTTGASAATSPHVYWANARSNTIGEANVDGTDVNEDFITATSVAPFGTEPLGVAVDGKHVYFTNAAGTIGEANLDGTDVNQSLITTPERDTPFGVAVDGQHIYWADETAGTIGEANLDGTDVNDDFITGANAPTGVAVDGQHIYWDNTNSNTIGEANLDGTDVNQSFISGANGPAGVAVDGQHVYWTNFGSGTIGEANLDGTDVNQSFITGAGQPFGIAVDGQHVYWANDGIDTIAEANLDGTDVNESFITGVSAPFGVAVSVLTETPTSTGLTVSPNQSLETQPVTLTATVSPAPDGGTVAFDDGSGTIAGCGAQPINGNGVATCQTSSLPAGSDQLTAAYGGDQSYQASTSPAVAETILLDTPPNLANLTWQYVEGSAKFQALGAFEQTLVKLLANQAIAALGNITPQTAPTQLASLVGAYEQGVTALQAQGWLTAGQASTLNGLATNLTI